jgi:uncharacterized membrane protein YeaQ/YmgE (transglycosylase-associated protein family)
MNMELIVILAIGILAGQSASFVYGGYSLGALGNGIAGLTGALFLGNYFTVLFGMSIYLGMFAGGAAGALFILAVFSAGEAMVGKKKRFF